MVLGGDAAGQGFPGDRRGTSPQEESCVLAW